MHFHSLFTLLQNHKLVYTDHTRKIELVRYLMSSYVHGKVLDTLSEHANALASSAMASLEDEADQLSHFPFLPMPCDLVLTVPRHHGWYRKHLSSCEVMNSIAVLCPCAARDLQTLALQISAVAHCAAFSCRSAYVSHCSPTPPMCLKNMPELTPSGNLLSVQNPKPYIKMCPNNRSSQAWHLQHK